MIEIKLSTFTGARIASIGSVTGHLVLSCVVASVYFIII